MVKSARFPMDFGHFDPWGSTGDLCHRPVANLSDKRTLHFRYLANDHSVMPLTLGLNFFETNLGSK